MGLMVRYVREPGSLMGKWLEHERMKHVLTGVQLLVMGMVLALLMFHLFRGRVDNVTAILGNNAT